MYERLPLNFIGITDNYGTRKDPITGVTSYHYGIDLGWHSYQGEPIYAIYDSSVVLEDYDKNLGNYIVLSYKKGNNTIIYRYLHMKNRASVKNGEKVTRGQIIGYMGQTGYATGTHLHFEYWICPKEYNYNVFDRPKYAVNPLSYCYLFDNQSASSASISSIMKVVGTEKIVKRNTSVDQIEVFGEKLSCYSLPNISANNILGYIDYGIYNIIEVKNNNDHMLYKIDDNKWIIEVDNISRVYLKDQLEQEALQAKIKLLEQQVIDLQKKSINNCSAFTALYDGKYYISLKKGETIYYPK